MANSLTVKVLSQTGEELRDLTLNENVFGIEPNQQAMFDAVVMQQASLRQGTHDTKGRSEVSGGGKKPWRQKGTGHARQGSTRAPQWRHGGTVFGPTPRSYGYRLNRKVRRLALRSYLSEIVAEGKMKVVDQIQLDAIKTKDFVKVMSDLNVDRKVLFVFDVEENWENVWLSMRNLPNANFTTSDGLNCLDLANAYDLVMTEAAVKKVEEALQ